MWKELIYIALLTTVLTYLEIKYLGDSVWLKDLMAVYSLIGFVLSLLLVFRTNTGYDRWWEGRKKWGELVNNTRNFALKIASSNVSHETNEYFKRMIPNLSYAIKEHLREGVKFSELNLTDNEKNNFSKKNHVPNAIVNDMHRALQKERQIGNITDIDVLYFEQNVNAFADIYGACERIKNTPIPYSYSLFLKKFIVIYVTTLPLALITSFGYWSILLATFIFYVLVSMEVLAEEIEDPFGKDDNDLPTDELCEKIKENIHEIMS
jgi:putative membrane protein